MTTSRQEYNAKQRRTASSMLDVVCCLLAVVILLSYILRRYEARLHRSINSSCFVPSEFVVVAAGTFLRRRDAPLCDAAVTTSTTTGICVGTTRTQGLGLFATKRMACGEPVGVALDTNNGTHSNRGVLDDYIPQVTAMAGKLNHCSSKFNTRIVPERFGASASAMLMNGGSSSRSSFRKDGSTRRWILMTTAIVTIGEELTIDYNDLPWFLWQPAPWWRCGKNEGGTAKWLYQVYNFFCQFPLFFFFWWKKRLRSRKIYYSILTAGTWYWYLAWAW